MIAPAVVRPRGAAHPEWRMNNMRIDRISKKDIEAHSRAYEGLTEIMDRHARHVIAGIVSAPEFDIGV